MKRAMAMSGSSVLVMPFVEKLRCAPVRPLSHHFPLENPMPVAHRFGRIEKVVSRSSLETNQRERETPSGLLNPVPFRGPSLAWLNRGIS